MTLSLSDQAEEDLAGIADYYFARNPEAAAKVYGDLVAAFDQIALMPEMGRERPELGTDLRSFVVGSYVIFYVYRTDQIIVTRIIHGSRDIEREFQ